MVNWKSSKMTEPKRSTLATGVDKLQGAHADTIGTQLYEKFPIKVPFFLFWAPGEPSRRLRTSPRSSTALGGGEDDGGGGGGGGGDGDGGGGDSGTRFGGVRGGPGSGGDTGRRWGRCGGGRAAQTAAATATRATTRAAAMAGRVVAKTAVASAASASASAPALELRRHHLRPWGGAGDERAGGDPLNPRAR